jgi:hypothetical protein
MSELLVAVAAGAVWCLPFVLLVLWAGPARGRPLGPAVLMAYPLFFAFQVLLAKGAAWVGLLDRPSLGAAHAVLVLGLGALCWRGLKGRASERADGVRRERGGGHDPGHDATRDSDADVRLVRRIVLGTAGAALAALALFALVSPVHVWDVLAYHMPMVASYVQNGSLEPWPTQDLRQIHRVNAGELQLLVVALLARSDAWVELPNLLGLGVFLVAALELGRLVLDRRLAAWLVAGLVLTAPQVLAGAATAKNDLMFSAVLLCALFWMIRAGEKGESRVTAALGLAALSGSLAAATKVMGLNVLGASGLLALALAYRGRLRWGQVAAFTALAVGALLLLVGDVYWRNFTRSAIPVGIAPGELHVSVGLVNLVEAVRLYAYDLSFKRLVTPLRVEHDFLHYGYLFPFALVLGVAGAARQLRLRRYGLGSLALASAALFASVIAVRIPLGWDQRFMLWMIPVAGILALSLAERVAPRGLIALAGLVAGLTLANLSLILTMESDRLVHRSVGHLAATGSLARYVDVPNERYQAWNAGFEVLDQLAAPTDTVLYAGTTDTWMYLAWGPRFTRRVEGVRDAAHAAEQVASRRHRFVVLEHATPAEIEEAVLREAARAGYEVRVRTERRLILVREP